MIPRPQEERRPAAKEPADSGRGASAAEGTTAVLPTTIASGAGLSGAASGVHRWHHQALGIRDTYVLDDVSLNSRHSPPLIRPTWRHQTGNRVRIVEHFLPLDRLLDAEGVVAGTGKSPRGG